MEQFHRCKCESQIFITGEAEVADGEGCKENASEAHSQQFARNLQ